MSVKHTAKKTLAVFLAVLMVMSTWGGLTPFSLKAEALADAGKYTVRVNYNVGKKTGAAATEYKGKQSFIDTVPDDENDYKRSIVGFSIFYNTENGTGEECEAWWNIGQVSKTAGTTLDGDSVSAPTLDITSGGENGYAVATISGFPTSLFVGSKCSARDNNSVGTFTISSIEIKSADEDDSHYQKLWSGSYSFSSKNRRYYGTLSYTSGMGTCEGFENDREKHVKCSYDEGYENGWSLPTATKIDWQTDAENWTDANLNDLTIAETDDVSRTAKFEVLDQYGVNMSTTALTNLYSQNSEDLFVRVYADSYPNLNSQKTLLKSEEIGDELLYYTTQNNDGSPYEVTVTAKSDLKSEVKGLNERKVTVNVSVGDINESKSFVVKDPKYVIAFNANGDGANVAPKTVDVYYGESLESSLGKDNLPTASRAGYSFLGFYDAMTDGNKLDTGAKIYGGATYYAQWDANTYAVVYLGRDGQYLGVEYVPYSTNATAVDSTTNKDITPDSIDKGDATNHYVLKSGDDTWSPSIKNIGGNTITTAQYDEVKHTFGGGVTVPANCQHGNATKYTCTVCGYEKIENDDGKIGACTPSEEWTIVTEPTCTADGKVQNGKKVHLCTVCGKQVGETAEIPASHTYTHEVTKKATCNAEGEMTYTCTKCGYSYTEKIAKTQHSYSASTTVDPTCTSSGYTVMKCSCGDTYNAYNGTAPTDHDWKFEYINTSHNEISVTGTCQNEGCEATFTTTVNSTHTLDKIDVDVESYKAPTCQAPGSITIKCGVEGCTETHTVTLPANADAHNYTTQSNPATCTNTGYIKTYCTVCEKTLVEQLLPIVAHNYVEGKVTKNATCTETGIKEYECGVCHGKKTETIPTVAHKEVTTQATCTEGGKTYCTECGWIFKTTEKANHKWSETDGDDGWKTLVKPTCQNGEVKIRTCLTCGCTEINKSEQTAAHNYVGYFIDEEPTCTTPGQKSKHCSVCYTIDETSKVTISALGHNWNDGEITTSAKCETEGVKTYSCSRCTEKKTETIAALGHDYSVEGEKKASTCKEVGYTEYKCSHDGCGETEKRYSDTLGEHDWSAWETKQEADETHPKIEVRQCSVCKLYDYKYTQPTGDHEYTGVVTLEPTCTKEGTKTYTCTKADCKLCTEAGTRATYTETISATGHKWNSGTEVPADCTHSGYTHYTCENGCGETYDKIDATGATGHTWGEGVINQGDEATCTKDGKKTYTCTVCETATKTEVIGKLGHEFEEISTQTADCTKAGYKEYKCKNCTETYKEYTADAKGHSWGEWTVTADLNDTSKVNIKRICANDSTHTETYSVNVSGALTTGEHTLNVVSQTSATCHSKGSITIACTSHVDDNNNNTCGCKFTVEIPKTQHNLKTDYTAPTCKNDGSIKVYCNNKDCTFVHEDTVLEALGHNYVAGEHHSADCTHSGYTDYTCDRTNCGDTIKIYDENEKVASHVWKDTPKSNSATCTKGGEIVYECKTCNSTVTVKTEALGHKWDEGTKIVEGDCENAEVTRYKCTRAGCEAYVDVLTNTSGTGKHEYEFTKTVEPTCTEDGYDLYTCKSCSGTEKRNIVEAKGHDWGNWEIVTYPTETTNGLQRRQCLTCGEPDEQEIVWGEYYLITFYNFDGIRLMPPAYYQYGEKAIRPKKDPVRVSDAGYTYEFIGWSFSDGEIDFVTKQMAVIAQYKAIERHYDVTYKNEDGTVLGTIENVAYTQIGTTYTSQNGKPTKDSDKYYDYSFSTWSVACDTDTGTAVATAVYTSTRRPADTNKDDNTSSDNGESLFTRIINWFKALFNKIFGR